MSHERADLNWYHNPPDYFAGRDRTARAAASAETPLAQTAQRAMAGPDHDTAPGEFTFDDFLDIINPLHHLPVISSIYREMTGDQISPHARIIGGGIFGGGSGFVAAIANAISEEATGRDLGDNLMAAVFGEDEGDAETVAARTAPGAKSDQGPSPSPAAPVAEGPAVQDLPSEPDVSSVAAPHPEAVPRPAVQAASDTAALPPAPPLEGEAALNALFADLRGHPRGADVASPPSAADQAAMSKRPSEAARRSGPAPGASGPGGIAVDPALFASQSQGPAGPATPERSRPAFTDQMLRGLQKYEEMMGRRPTTQAGLDAGGNPGG